MQICLCSSMKQEGKKPSSLVSTNCFKPQHQDTRWSFFPEVKRSFFSLITGWGGTTVASGQGLVCGTPVGKESFCLGSSIWEGAVPTLIQDTGFLNNSTAFLFWHSHKLYSLLPQGLNFFVSENSEKYRLYLSTWQCNDRITGERQDGGVQDMSSPPVTKIPKSSIKCWTIIKNKNHWNLPKMMFYYKDKDDNTRQWESQNCNTNRIPVRWGTNKVKNNYITEVIPQEWDFWVPCQALHPGDLASEGRAPRAFGFEGQWCLRTEIPQTWGWTSETRGTLKPRKQRRQTWKIRQNKTAKKYAPNEGTR